MKRPITPVFQLQPVSSDELLRAWREAGSPSRKGPHGGKQFFGMSFENFYLMLRAYPLDAPDLSMAASTGLGFDKEDGHRAFVFAAGVAGYHWVAVQHATNPNTFSTEYPMETFHSPCSTKDVVPTISRWAPGVRFHWTSSPGPRHLSMPYGWNAPTRYKWGKPRLQFRAIETPEGLRIRVNVAPQSITMQKKYRVVGVCARPSKLHWVLDRFHASHDPHAVESGLLDVTPRLLKLICRWSAQHFHNAVLK